jgi:hypothetical protein
LFHKLNPPNEVARRLGIGFAVAGADDDGDLLNPRASGFVQDDAERGTLHAVAIDECLEWDGVLVPPGGGDNGFANFHGGIIGCGIIAGRLEASRTENQRGEIYSQLHLLRRLRMVAGHSHVFELQRPGELVEASGK